MGAPKGVIPWNRGLIKEEDSRLGGGRPKGIPMSEEQKQLRSKLYKGRTAWNKGMPATESQLKGFKYGNEARWKNHVKVGEYPSNWKDIRKLVLERDFRCVLCGSENIKPGWLHVHHIDWNKSNNSLYNLMVLCSSCHMKIQSQDKFKKLFYDFVYSHRFKTKIPLSDDGSEFVQFEFSIDGVTINDSSKDVYFGLFEAAAKSFDATGKTLELLNNWREKRKCLSQQV